MRVKAKRKEKKRKAIHGLAWSMDRNGMELNVGKKRESME